MPVMNTEQLDKIISSINQKPEDNNQPQQPKVKIIDFIKK